LPILKVHLIVQNFLPSFAHVDTISPNSERWGTPFIHFCSMFMFVFHGFVFLAGQIIGAGRDTVSCVKVNWSHVSNPRQIVSEVRNVDLCDVHVDPTFPYHPLTAWRDFSDGRQW
jgi:hypothetical protein